MDYLWRDLRQSIRLLRATPGISALAIATLAVGIGANATIFSAVSALLLRPLPIPDADRIVVGLSLREGFDPFGTSLLDYAVFRDNAPDFSSTGIAATRAVNLIDRDDAERVTGADVSGTYLSTLAVQPIVGRRLTVDDDRPGGPAIAMIGYDLWRRRFGGRPDVIGQAFTTDDGVWTIVGVMPHGFDLPVHAEIWMPARLDITTATMDRRASHNWIMVGRLRPESSMASANASLRALAQRIEREYPQFRRGWSYEIISLRRELADDVEGRSDRALMILVAAVGFLLIICCANVAGLLLVRGLARQREIAVRLALGAGRRRIAQQLVTESAVLAVVACSAGLLLTSWMLPLVSALNPIRSSGLADFVSDFRIDARVLVFAAAISIVCVAIFGIVPALKIIATGDLAVTTTLRDQRASIDAAGQHWLDALVVVEIAIAVMLLVGGSVVVESFQRLRQSDLGFRPEHTLTFQLDLTPAKYPRQSDRDGFVNRVLRQVRAIPGVDAAGTSTNLPLDDLSYDSTFTVEGRPPPRQSDVPITAHRMVTPGYLEALGVRLLRGRLIDERDRADSLRVAVITEEFARQAWPGDANPIGRRVRRGTSEQTDQPWLTVVGLVADTKEDQFNFRIARPVWYLPYSQVETAASIKVVLHTSADPIPLTAFARAAVKSIDPQQPLTAMRSMIEQVSDVTMRDRFSAVLIGWLAFIGIVFAACGLYGVVAYTVQGRRREFGLRLAIGASPANILGLVLTRGAWLVATGLIVGLIAARLLTRALAATLFEIRPGDPTIFGAVALFLALVGLLACYIPARSASRADPGAALRG